MYRATPFATLLICLLPASATMARQALSLDPSEAFDLGLRGAHFVPNHGQWSDDEVYYGLRTRGLDVALRESEMTMHLSRDAEPGEPGRLGPTNAARSAAMRSSDRLRSGPLKDAHCERLTLTITFPGSNPVTPRGAQPQPARFNYFIGDDESKWAGDVPSFGAIVYENLYDGIDLRVLGSDDGVLKYEFHCDPGADYGQIRIAYDGITSLCIDDAGNLNITTSFGTLADTAPIVWQEVDGLRRPIQTRFELVDARACRFALDGPVDPTRKIIIDPDLQWMQYLGGTDREWASDLAVDQVHNAVVIAGHTGSPDFEGRGNEFHGGSSDVFVVRLDSEGLIEWMTYLGGSGNLTFDLGIDIDVDDAGNALVTGWTNSPDFAGRNNAPHGLIDAFVARINADGLLDWMTYLGGTADDLGFGIAVDATGAAFVTGEAYSTNFDGRINSHHGGNYDAFVLRVLPSGTLDWMTYLGGRDQDEAQGVAIDDSGAAWIAGDTWSGDFEGRINFPKGNRDAYVMRVLPSGAIDWMVYLGGSANDVGAGIVLDGETATLVGYTTSIDIQNANNVHHGGSVDTFVMRTGPRGAVQWATYLGGNGWDSGLGITVDASGAALVCGRTESADFEGRDNSFFGDADAYFARVPDPGIVEWMTYLGGRGADAGFGVALDAAGTAWVTGYTASTDFFGRRNEYHGGDYDAFVLNLRLAEGPRLTAAATCPQGGPIQVSWQDATPNGQVALIFALTQGTFRVPNGFPCIGTRLGLGSNQIQLAFQGSAGPNGSRTLNANAGPNACGGYLQLLDLTTCATSNVARIE